MSFSVLLHCHLLLANGDDEIDNPEFKNCDRQLVQFSKDILNGEPYLVFQETLGKIQKPLLVEPGCASKNALDKLREFLNDNLYDTEEHLLLLVAISLLQTFIQNNFTGPLSPVESSRILTSDGECLRHLNKLATEWLSSGGQQAYGLMEDPLSLVLSLLIFERLTRLNILSRDNVEEEIQIPTTECIAASSFSAAAFWWLGRALMVHLSLLGEPSGILPTVASAIFSSVDIAHAITKNLPDVFNEVKLGIYTIYYLENIKCSLALRTEHLCLPSLIKVKKLRSFQFVLTGARAKRTKFQRDAHAGLIILAKSSTELYEKEITPSNKSSPEEFNLESDLLLERPYFESLADEPLNEQIIKKPKLDENIELEDEKILPLALRQENIPNDLLALDPNSQPQLTSYDDIQLLLRLYVIRQTSPAKDPLVEEELGALLSRVIYQEGHKNWSIFSRALWERSIIETTKAKTLERGLLQMQSLVEELGLKIQTRLLPEESSNFSSRLAYIHQLPFVPRWELDSTLAEKYMSLGILKSAVQIYERLQMPCEVALCYAAVGDEKQAEEVLVMRIEDCPNDARALSILGDIRQDPALWQKSWDIGKYVNAKNSLARYYYNPPQVSGLSRDYDATLKNLNDSLRQFPLSFDTWYFYGCVGLECDRMQLAAEAFSRCVSLDPTHSLSWSNLSAAYVKLGKMKEAFSCLKKAVSSDAQMNWRIWENYMLVAIKLNEWNDVLLACKKLVSIKRDKAGEGSIDVHVVEKLVEILVSTDYSAADTQQLSHYQKSCIDFVCNTLPSVITTNPRCWRIVAKVELWRKRPWAALDCHEKAYRAVSHNPDLDIDEKVWDETVDACEDLVAAYESMGEMQGKFGPDSLVCKDWKYKSRATIKALISKGKHRWEGSDGWERLLELKKQL